jgi:hypothetical protein
MNGSNTFKDDLKAGIEIEKRVLYILQKKYPCASLIGAYKGYDIWIPELHQSVEVKYDPMSKQTGNIVVEIEMFGKPSGIMASTADWWVFYDDEMYIIMKREHIINCIFLSKLVYKEFTGTGDFQPKKAFLVPKNILFKYGKPL